MKYLLFLFVLSSIELNAQWTDNFSDLDFSSNPVWSGDTSKFTVNGAGQLQLNAPAVNGLAYLSAASSVGVKASWSFTVKMDFNPSSSNYARVYLMSDQPNVSLPLNGYYLRIGYTNDDLCLIRKQGDSETIIADGRDKIFNTTTVNARIKVTRDEQNTWTLLCDTTGGENFNISATATDNTILNSQYFGIQCIYSSTRSTKFYFDDFVVTGEVYSEPKPTADTSRLFDIMFNEIMADPSPVAGLPECEYLELYNRSTAQIDLTGWKLIVGTNSFVFPAVQIPSDGYLIVTTKGDTSKFSSFGKVLGLFTSSTTLNNTGQYMKLENRDGRLIDWMEYDDSWYCDEFKAQGGYSLEQIDPQNPCGGKANWKASKANKGGTPGSKNSIYTENSDIASPDLVKVNVPNDSTLLLYFSEPMDTVELLKASNYQVDQGIGTPKVLKVAESSYTTVELNLQQPLQQHIIYHLTIQKNLTDCAGNLSQTEISVPVGLPVMSDSCDVVINEVLFNAKTGGADYIELYNRSSRMINARNLLIGIKEDGVVKNLCRLSDPGFLIAPGDYLVLTEDMEKVRPFYQLKNEKCFVNLTSIPSLDDKASTIVLLNDTFGRVDEFSYSETMHLPVLKNLDGISLERVNPDRLTQLVSNWHSAAESAGYGTPGYQNSQFLKDIMVNESVTLSDELFSPDNDGYKDVLQVSYKFNKADCRLQVTVFDAAGKLIKRLLNNELVGTSGAFTWDGTNDAGKLCGIGMYVVFIRAVFDDGTVTDYKKTCVLALKR